MYIYIYIYKYIYIYIYGVRNLMVTTICDKDCVRALEETPLVSYTVTLVVKPVENRSLVRLNKHRCEKIVNLCILMNRISRFFY